MGKGLAGTVRGLIADETSERTRPIAITDLLTITARERFVEQPSSRSLSIAQPSTVTRLPTIDIECLSIQRNTSFLRVVAKSTQDPVSTCRCAVAEVQKPINLIIIDTYEVRKPWVVRRSVAGYPAG
jgi:hypothetical protein